MSARIYLDHAATTPPRPEALAAMGEGFAIWANPSSPHAEGRRSRATLEDARARVKAALGWAGEVIFTSGASEALAIGLGRARIGGRLAERWIVSAVEHDAVFRAAPGAETARVAAGPGEVDRAALADLLDSPLKAVVAIQHVNSETGAVQPLDALAREVRTAGGLLVADCSQSAGKLALPDADMLVISAHKLGGPVGIGALLVRDFAMLEPVGGHERGYRAGTENLPAALGFAAALETGGLESWATSGEHRESFANALGCSGGGCDYIFSLAHAAMSAQALLIRLDALGFAVSAGSACSSGSLKPSRVLQNFGVPEDEARRTIRVSLGWNTTIEDLGAFVQAWKKLG